ncbi:MAG: uroporphyrinogen decarboxylase family protein [Pseudomonadota bacterium]
MTVITGRDRIRACMKRSIADRIPVGLILGPFKARVLGCSLKDYWTDGKKLAEATVACYELFQHDSLDISWDIGMEAETVGAPLEFPNDSVPRVQQYILSRKSALASLRLPDPDHSGRFPQYIEACRAVAKTLQGPSLSGTITGPWTIAAGLRGAQELIYDTVDDPSFVDDLMKFTTEVTKILGSRVIETGLSLSMGEAASSCSLISPAIYRRFIKPRHQEIIQFFRERKAGLSLHVCGYLDPIMEDLVDLGIVALSLDSPSSLRRMVEVSQKKIVLIGNVATSLFVNGTEEEIESSVQECIRTAASGGAYIVSSGCELPYNATRERAQFFIKAAREYGKAERILAG